MGWTPPSKFTVLITFLLMVFGLFICIDLFFLFPDGNELLVQIDISMGDFTQYEVWAIIAMVVVFLSWFIFYLGVRLSGL
ncbi:MAG: hypothetical protein ACFFBE_01185 [Promethearchaeota archaeon]